MAAARHPLPRQHRGNPVGERPGAAAEGRRRTARRLRALPPPPRGRLVARPHRRARTPPARTVAGLRTAPPPDRRLPLLLRPDARSALGPVPAPPRGAPQIG